MPELDVQRACACAAGVHPGRGGKEASWGTSEPCCTFWKAFHCVRAVAVAGEVWQGGEQGEEDEERDTEPTPLHRPKRFDDWGSSGGDGRSRDGRWARRRLGGGGGRGIDIEQPTPEQLEQQRQQRQLDAAVKKLEKQGAQVPFVRLYCCTAAGSGWVSSSSSSSGGCLAVPWQCPACCAPPRAPAFPGPHDSGRSASSPARVS